MENKITLSSLVNEQLNLTKDFLLNEEGKERTIKEEIRAFYKASKLPFLISSSIILPYHFGEILSQSLLSYFS